MKQINESEAKATAAYNEAGELVFMTRVEEVADFVQLPSAAITKAMPHNIQKYHKFVPPG